MDKKGMRVITCILGMLLSVGLLQIEAIGKKPIYQTEWKHRDNTVTIVLREPWSEPPHLIISSEAEGKRPIKGLAVQLPKYTSVFFKVDQVNTLLYTITITQEKPKSEKGSEPAEIVSVDKALKLIEQARKCCPKESAKVAFDALACKVNNANDLNKKLDKLLETTEAPKFYTQSAADIDKAFAKIATGAQKATKTEFELPKDAAGTAQEFCDAAVAALKEVHRNCKDEREKILRHVPEDLSDTSNAIVAVFIATAKKLRAIETSEWSKADTETRILKEEIKYICIFTPKKKNAKLKPITHTVTITPKVGLSGILVTVGPFITDVRDDHYVKDQSDKIALGAQDRFATPPGGLVHAVICGKDFSRFSSALAVSIGFAVGTKTKDAGLILNGQPALGGSLIFSGPGGEGDIFAVTLGGVTKPVQRLNGYWVGDPFPKDPNQLSRAVYRGGWFISITTNFDLFLSKILGSKKDTSTGK